MRKGLVAISLGSLWSIQGYAETKATAPGVKMLVDQLSTAGDCPEIILDTNGNGSIDIFFRGGLEVRTDRSTPSVERFCYFSIPLLVDTRYALQFTSVGIQGLARISPLGAGKVGLSHAVVDSASASRKELTSVERTYSQGLSDIVIQNRVTHEAIACYNHSERLILSALISLEALRSSNETQESMLSLSSGAVSAGIRYQISSLFCQD